jgi:hypothetical protein
MAQTQPRDNLLLAALSPQTRRALEPDLTPIRQKLQQVLNSPGSPGDIVFPRTSVISVLTQTGDGQSVENAVVGYEGVFAVDGGATNVKGLVLAEGLAWGMSRAAFERHEDNHEFRAAVSLFEHQLLAFTCQSCVCQAFHTAEQRLARWLLEMRDRVLEDELSLTQEFLASMLGVHRPTVTIAARILQAADMIHYRYGRVTIVDRDALEEACCECYSMLPRPGAGSGLR